MKELTLNDLRKLHLFRVFDKKLIFDPVSLSSVEADDDLWSMLAYCNKLDGATNNDDLARTLDGKFTKPKARTMLRELQKLKDSGSLFAELPPSPACGHNWSISYVVLQISHSCNLSCRYCFAGGGAYRGTPVLMSEETARRAVDFLLNQFGPGKFSFGFFGGEPLMNFNLLKKVVGLVNKEAAKRDKKTAFHVTTNGILLTKDVVEFLIHHNFTLIVSIDGPKPLHDEMRVFKNGSGSFDVIVRNLQNIKRTPLAKRTTLRSTYCNVNPMLNERVLFLCGLAEQGYSSNVSVEPACLSHQSCGTANSEMRLTKDSLRSLKSQYSRLAKTFVSRAKDGNPLPFFHFIVMLKRLTEGKRNEKECGAGLGYVVVNPFGELYACHHEGKTKIGDLENGYDEFLRRGWLSNNIYERPKCCKCWARYLCGGGCRVNAIEINNDVSKPWEVECELKQHWIRLCIWILSELTEDEIRSACATN